MRKAHGGVATGRCCGDTPHSLVMRHMCGAVAGADLPVSRAIVARTMCPNEAGHRVRVYKRYSDFEGEDEGAMCEAQSHVSFTSASSVFTRRCASVSVGAASSSVFATSRSVA